MLSGEPCRPSDPELANDAQRACDWMVRYNAALAASPEVRRALLRMLFAHVGEGSMIRPPFYCDYGEHITIGNGVLLNFNCVILDVAPVSIGDLTQVGTGVQFLTADHPRDPALRREGVEFGLPIMGKPMGNGIPVGAVAMQPELVAEFGRNTRYFNTFGGNPVCIAAAQAVLDVIRDENLQANSLKVGGEMMAGIRELAGQYPQIGDVRGAGLFVGVDFVKDRETREPDAAMGLQVVNRLREKRVLISASGVEGNVLKIRPPLPFTSEHNRQFLALLGETLAEVA